MTLNHLLAHDVVISDLDPQPKQKYRSFLEAKLPVQSRFRYFPYLARWQMKHVQIFPEIAFLFYFTVMPTI
jgi:hypothetical protein